MTSVAQTPVHRELGAMSCDVELVCYAPDAGRRLARAERWLRGFESRFSRFQPASELSRLNAAAGRPFSASPRLMQLAGAALALACRSGGVFDPTVLRSLEAAGYDRSFELLDRRWPPDPLSPRERARVRVMAPQVTWHDVKLEPVARTITLPAGAGIDLGGIGKGWAVDRLARILGAPCLVNAGGDVFAAGRPHDAGAWLVGVEDPFAQSRDLMVLALRDRAVATSSQLRRRWSDASSMPRVLSQGAACHHLIDPRTGAPSTSVAVQVTAVAPAAMLADYHAKVALLLGAEAGLAYLNREAQVEGLIVRRDGMLLESNGLYELRA